MHRLNSTDDEAYALQNTADNGSNSDGASTSSVPNRVKSKVSKVIPSRKPTAVTATGIVINDSRHRNRLESSDFDDDDSEPLNVHLPADARQTSAPSKKTTN